MFVRYGRARKRLLPSGYRVEIHRDNFYFFGMPGSGGDMQGFCKVIPPDNRSKAAYFYFDVSITKPTAIHGGGIKQTLNTTINRSRSEKNDEHDIRLANIENAMRHHCRM